MAFARDRNSELEIVEFSTKNKLVLGAIFLKIIETFSFELITSSKSKVDRKICIFFLFSLLEYCRCNTNFLTCFPLYASAVHSNHIPIESVTSRSELLSVTTMGGKNCSPIIILPS